MTSGSTARAGSGASSGGSPRPGGRSLFGAVWSRPTGNQRIFLFLTAGLGISLSLWASHAPTDGSLLACLITLWALLAVNAGSLGGVAFSLAVLSLYACGDWLAALAGARYPPFYRVSTLFESARWTLATVTAALSLVALVLAVSGIRKASDVWRSFAARPAQPRSPWIQIIGLVGWAMMLRDLYVLLPRLGAVINSPRRAFAESLWVTSSINVQLIYLAIAAAATLAWPSLGRGLRVLLVSPLAAAVLVELSVGSRKEILLGLFMAFPILWLRQSRRALLTVVIGALVGVALALPALRDADTSIVPTEFALPGYASVAALNGEVSPISIPYDFWHGIWALIPSVLRPVAVNIDLGSQFAKFGFQSVGVGATPWLEAALGFPGAPLLAATLIIALLHVSWQLMLKRLPLLAVTGWPFLVLLGRSTFWIAVFGTVYLTLLTSLAVTYDSHERGWTANAKRRAES